MAGQSPQAEANSKKGVSKSKQRPPKLLLSSDSSSSIDSSEASLTTTKEQRAAPARVSSSLSQPAGAKVISKGLNYEPSDERSKNFQSKPAWASADPLLSVDFQPAAPLRIKSAVIVRKSTGKDPTATHPQSASTEVRSKEYQQLSRSTSKAAASKVGGPDAPQAASGEEVPRGRSKGSVPTREKSRLAESPRSKRKESRGLDDQRASPSTPSRSSVSSREAVAQSLQEPVPGDAWATSLANEAAKVLKREPSKVPVSRAETQKSTGSRKPSSVGPVPAKDPKVFAKQQPKLPTKRGGNADEEDESPWSDSLRSTSLQKPPTKQPSSGAATHHKADARSSVSSDVFGAHEGQLAGNAKQISELEALLKETTARHKEELERQRAQNRALAEEVLKARTERDTAVERIRKEADARVEACDKGNQAKIDEIKKEALARQNSTKMQCAASVRELKEQVASLEKQLKAKKEEFEDEKRLLKKSFDERRKSDIELQERKAQAHQEELKNKDSELLEHQNRMQALTSSVQTLTTSLAQMKELNDISRTATQALEEKSKTQAAYIKTLMKRDESLRSQAAKMMPIKEAKRLAFRALLKGRAVEMISRACMSTDAGLWNKAWAFQQFVDLIGGGRGSNENRQDTIESRLMQFRKEQMFLMAENERLMAKVAQLQQEGVNQKQNKAALLEQALMADAHRIETSTQRARDEAVKHTEYHVAPRDPFSKESAGPEVFLNDVYTTFNQGYADLNAPLAHQPHYYRQLPSVRNPARGRNLFVPVVHPSPPVQGYLPHPGYSNPHLTVGVPPGASRGRRVGSSPGIPNAFPSGPYDATQPVDERGAIFRVRGTQQDLRRVMMDVNDRGGTRIVGKKLPNTSFQS
ncbi:hypothetical protein ACSSS7_004544 [Eimeria intestinalis]